MAKHTGEVQLELAEREEEVLLKCVSRKLYKEIMRNHEFPYDSSKKTQDKRKIYTRTTGKWHLKQHGAAYYGSRKVIGPNYRGPTPQTRQNVISLIWSMKKAYGPDKSRIFDYAEIVLDQSSFFEVYPTDHEIDKAMDECIDEWWARNYA